MSGHSHWSTIKRKKQANDQQKGREFSRASREIMLAIVSGNNITDPEKNVRLRAAIYRAKEVNMPKENIKRLLTRVEERASQVTEAAFEALGPENTSLIITVGTDNLRRTQTDVKIALDKLGCKLVEKGAVMYQFDLLTMFTVANRPENEVLNLIEALGAIDFSKKNNTYYIYTSRDQFNEAWQKARELGFAKAPELVYKPKTLVKLSEAGRKKLSNLIEKIYEIEEIQGIYCSGEEYVDKETQ